MIQITERFGNALKGVSFWNMVNQLISETDIQVYRALVPYSPKT